VTFWIIYLSYCKRSHVGRFFVLAKSTGLKDTK